MGGHVDWNDWSFDWDLVDLDGLNLSNVHFAGRKILHKGSLPAIRVWYEDGSGPFVDQMGEDGFARFSDCNDKYVCLTSFAFDGTDWIDIRCACSIGAYRIQQAWQFGRDGRLVPRLASRGVHSPSIHVHHVHWRLDFDIDGHGNHEVWVHDQGDVWGRYTTETRAVKQPGRRWLVRSRNTGRGMWITPGPHDGHDDNFCRGDLAIRAYAYSEDEPWPYSCREQLGYDNNQNVLGRDIVVWYISHLRHDATHEESGSLGEWHFAGPTLEFADIAIDRISVKHFMKAKGLDPATGIATSIASTGITHVKEYLLN